MANRQVLRWTALFPLICLILLLYGASKVPVGLAPHLKSYLAVGETTNYQWKSLYDNKFNPAIPAQCDPKSVVDVPVTIILTIYNQEDIIAEIMDTLLQTTIGPYHLITIFDACTDKSYEIVQQALNKYFDAHPLQKNRASQKGMTEYLPVVFDTAQYEVLANNHGLRLATTNYSIITQDDMLLTDHGWDRQMLRPIRAYDDIVAVTARCTHNVAFENNHYSWADLRGQCGYHDFEAEWTDTFVVRDTVNRGPLLVDGAKMRALNYFDEAFWPLNLDDHDMCLRAYQEFGWVCGLFPISVHASTEWSHRRNGKEPPTEIAMSEELNMKKILKRHSLYMTQASQGLNHNQEREVPMVD